MFDIIDACLSFLCWPREVGFRCEIGWDLLWFFAPNTHFAAEMIETVDEVEEVGLMFFARGRCVDVPGGPKSLGEV